jgi:hypothetical protein
MTPFSRPTSSENTIMRDDRDYKLDLSKNTGTAVPAASNQHAGEDARVTDSRPFLSVHFACCNVYLRIYRSPDGKSYQGRCPKCAKLVQFAVGEGGTDSRFFRVS